MRFPDSLSDVGKGNGEPAARRPVPVLEGDGELGEEGELPGLVEGHRGLALVVVVASVPGAVAVLVHATLGLEEEAVVEVCGGVGVAHGGAGKGSLLMCARRGCRMGGGVVLALGPCSEAAVERLEAVQGLGAEVGEPSGRVRVHRSMRPFGAG